jgi:hypothetical protein
MIRDALVAGWQTLKSGASGLIAAVPGWSGARTAFLGFAILVGGVCAWALLKPPLTPPDANVARDWHASISKYGLEVLYPPQEDFHVGDIWAMPISAAKENTDIHRRAVRIGSLDLTKLWNSAPGTHPQFEDTPEKSATGYRLMPKRVVLSAPSASEGIPLTIAEFPDLSITRAYQGGGQWSLAGWFGGADAQGDLVERISIPAVATYGASAVDIYGGYLRWCRAKETRALCTDKVVRQIFSYTNPWILDDKDGAYLHKLQLVVIARVYLMREINQQLVSTRSRGFVAEAPAPLVKAETTSETATSGSGDAKPPANAQDGAAARIATVQKNAGSAPGLRLGDAESSGITMPDRVFQRPLAFGYRSLAFALPASQPDRAPPADGRTP